MPKDLAPGPPIGLMSIGKLGSVKREVRSVYIQYVGFDVGVESRVYSFEVIEAKESRRFTIEVSSDAFRPLLLRFQDGPDICFAALKKGLQEETHEGRLLNHLQLGEQEVRAYLEVHRPSKTPGRRS